MLRGLLAGFAMLLASVAAGAAEGEIGQVSKRHYAGAMGHRTGLASEQLLPSTNVYADEVVRTPAQSETQLRFLDNTILQVGQMSEVVLDHYVYDPNVRRGEMTARFGTGVFRFVTGKMQNKNGFHLAMPTVAIAIRGTDFAMSVDASGATTKPSSAARCSHPPWAAGSVQQPAAAKASASQRRARMRPSREAMGLGDPSSTANDGGDSGGGSGGGHGGN